MDIMPFNFENKQVRVVMGDNGEPLFVGKDICVALGYVNHNDAMRQHCKGVVKRYPLQTPGGVQEVRVINEGDMFRLVVNSTLPSAETFERLVFEEILPSIRKTGSYTARTHEVPKEAFRLLPIVVRAARSLGLDKNAAAISANQAVAKMTGTNVMQVLGQAHLDAEQQILFFTPTDLGERIGVSGKKFNLLLSTAGLQKRFNDSWAPTPEAEGFYRVLDTGKRHADGSMVQQVKWSERVLNMVQPVTSVINF